MKKRFALLLCLLCLTGCRWTMHSGLPEHIRTVEIESFRNMTFDPGLDAKLTVMLKKMAMEDPQVRLVNEGGDARLSGRILSVTRRSQRLGRDDRPLDMMIEIVVEYTFFDEVEQRYLTALRRISSRQANSLAGLYRTNDPEGESKALDDALEALAREVIRGSIGMW